MTAFIKNQPVTYQEAKNLNLRFYQTGKPCKHNHRDLKYTTTKHCVECQKINSYNWVKRNRDKHRHYNKLCRLQSSMNITKTIKTKNNN